MTKDTKRIAEIKKKYRLAMDNENENRRLWIADMRFAHVPGAQWPDDLRGLREDPTSPRPCLEVNVLAQHVYQVLNDIRQNRPRVKVRPISMDADNDVAEVYDGVIRHIDSCSDGDIATDIAANHAITGGFGYFRIVTEYQDEEANEQEIRIRPIYNPLSVCIDPNSMHPAGADAEHCFIVDEIVRSKFEDKYGEDVGKWEGEGDSDSDWVTKESVRVCEYFERAERSQNILVLITGEEVTEEHYWETYQGDVNRPPVLRNKKRTEKYVKWTKLTSFKILEEGEFPSEYIPIIRIAGLIVDIDGERTYKGLVRDSMDAQRTYNYHWSNYIEMIALQPKIPYLVAEGQIEGHESEWNRANSANLPYLEYKVTDLMGNPVGPPTRQQLQSAPQGLMLGVQMSGEAIKMVTGQYDASLGQKSNETSGKAILARQHEGDTATYHFINGVHMAIRHKGRILIDMIPRVYDTASVMRILGENDETNTARLDPNQPEAVRNTQTIDGSVEKIYNLNVGRYDVIATAGPSYSTKRQEATDAMTEIMQGNPSVFPLIGDIWIRNQDWPGSDELADRIKIMLPPQIQQAEAQKNKTPLPPEVQAQIAAMTAQMQQMGQALQQAQTQMQGMDAQIKSKQTELQMKQIDMQIKQMEAQVTMQELGVKSQEVQAMAEQAGQPPPVAPAPEQSPLDVYRAQIDEQKVRAEHLKANADLMRAHVEMQNAGMQQDEEGGAPTSSISEVLKVLIQSQQQLVQAQIQMAQLVAAPRESVLVRDSNGRPVKAESHIVSGG